MLTYTRVGPHRNLNSGLHCPTEALPVSFNNINRLRGHHWWKDVRMFRCEFYNGYWGHECWYQKHISLDHQINQLVIQINAMFDRGNSTQQRIFDALRTLR